MLFMFNTWPGLDVKDSLVGTENRVTDIMVFDHGDKLQW